MGFLSTQSFVHSFLTYIQPLLVQSDDIQIYFALDSRNRQIVLRPSRHGWEIILNPNKTELIVIGDHKIRSSMKSSFLVSILYNIIEPDESVKNLGVILDADNSVQRYMADLVCICY